MERRLAAILAADVVGYSRLMSNDEEGTLVRLKAHRDEVADPSIAKHKGRIVKLMGDGMLAEFASVVDAVRCAVDIQEAMREHSADLPEDQRIQLRIGINLGDVIIDGEDIYGDGVNIAARLEGLSEVGGICVSGTVFDHVRNKVGLEFEDMGEQSVKNIKEPITVYQIRLQSRAPSVAAASNRPRLELPDEPSIAVLPFTNMSGDPEQEYFSDGITEDIITALSRIPRLFVVARHSTSTYKGKSVDIRQVGREQGVQFVLEGSVRKSGNRVRITAQLIDASTSDHRWADRYDRELNDIFAVQDEITRNVTIAVQVELTAGEQARLWAGGTKNIEAWECVVRGNEYVHRHAHEDNQEARRLADRALSLDPDYANAWVLFGLTCYEEALWDWSSSRETSLSTAEEAAKRAIELEEFSPDGFSLLSCVMAEQAEFDEAVEIGRKAVSLSPKHAPNVALYTVALGRAGKYQAALQQIRRAIRLSPIYPAWYLHILGNCSFAVGEDEEAVSAYRACLNPHFPDRCSFLAVLRRDSVIDTIG